VIRNQRNLHSIVQGAAAGMLAVAIALSAGLANAADEYGSQSGGQDTGNRIGISAASVGLTLLYAPVKMTYSALGMVFGGIAYGLSGGDDDVLHAVVTPAIRGDYVVFPEHIRREQNLEFFGRDPAFREERIVDSMVVEEIY
jgi:hypothetical protein